MQLKLKLPLFSDMFFCILRHIFSLSLSGIFFFSSLSGLTRQSLASPVKPGNDKREKKHGNDKEGKRGNDRKKPTMTKEEPASMATAGKA